MNTNNSDQNPARPGKPALANEAKTNTAAVIGICFAIPRNLGISLVCAECPMVPDGKKSV